jgi:hydrogenase expression/formation protein HypD
MENLAALRDPDLLRGLAERLRTMPAPPATLMEVCGTHTVAIARYGLRAALPPGVRLISGPGCPVCVTPQEQIDQFIALGRRENTVLATFGDMVRVPGSVESLEQARATGVAVLVVYSPLDAVAAAARQPEREVVFFGIGFETTAPAVGLAIMEAQARGLTNFSVLCAHKLIPPAMMALVEGSRSGGDAPAVTSRPNSPNIDGFLCPGHVSVIIGSDAYRPVAERGKPCVVAGFEAADVLRAVEMLLRQLAEGRAEVEIEYSRAVRAEGNRRAQELLTHVFRVVDARWRGLGMIPASGLALAAEFAEFDAARRFPVELAPAKEPAGCRCGEVLRGAIDPHECPLFGKACTPANPVGACMVSSEGACQAWYRYRRDEGP